ncbi:MAG: S-layer homology domain-containing protein [Chloroflexi bacterium]|nr:S-layer homology domain-containing protein [Chloroflexota bacterium]
MLKKSSIPRMLLVFVFLALLPTRSAHATVYWNAPITVDSSGVVGMYASMTMSNGHPAIAYYNATNSELRFVRAADSAGDTWDTPIVLDSAGAVGSHLSLAIVNGNPAISYYASNTLRYVRADDANGTTWGDPISVDATDNVGLYTSLVVINGNPAISYFDYTNNDLKYVRATDANGTGWGFPISVDSDNLVGEYTSLAQVNGRPAISYYDRTLGELKYVRSLDANGGNWGASLTLDTGNSGLYTSLAVVNGNPAVSYQDPGTSTASLEYVRATDADGAAWGAPVTIETGNLGAFSCLEVIGGNPAISYQSGTGPRYVGALDADGVTWDTPGNADDVASSYSSLLEVGGHPTLAYYDSSNGDLNFVQIDNEPPTVTIDQGAQQPDPTYLSPLTYDVVFSEPVTGFENTDVDISGMAGLPVVTVINSGDDMHFTVTIAGLTDGDFVSAVIPAGLIIDQMGNTNLVSTSTDNAIFYTTSLPLVVSINRLNASPTAAASVGFSVTFTEPVTGVDAGDFALIADGVGGASINPVSGSGAMYTVTVNTGYGGNGTLRLDLIDDDSIVDFNLHPLGDIGVDNGDFTRGQSYQIKRATFSDVPTTHWAWKQVESIYVAQITGGCKTNPLRYCPNNNVTRDQMAVFLLKAKHGTSYVPPDAGSSTGFTDVPVTHWAADWIKQLAAEGITGGCGGGKFCPTASVTREMMAVFLLSAEHGAGYVPPDAGASTGFADVPITYWAADWIKQLAAEGITVGCGGGNFCPKNPVTRAQMAIFLQATFNLNMP